jgi:agmatinase
MIVPWSFVTLAAVVTAHGQKPITGPHQSLWYNTIPGDGGTQVSTGGNA